MKMSDRTKQKMAKQREKRIKAFYNSYYSGDMLYVNKSDRYVVLAKKQLNEEYYFLVQNKPGELLLQKLVYSGSVRMVGVSKEGRQYARNKCIFDSWFKEAEYNLNRRLRSYYSGTSVGVVINQKYKIVLKREFGDKYYFVLRADSGKYLVAKLAWFEDISVVILSNKEFDKNKFVFSSWIKEALT